MNRRIILPGASLLASLLLAFAQEQPIPGTPPAPPSSGTTAATTNSVPPEGSVNPVQTANAVPGTSVTNSEATLLNTNDTTAPVLTNILSSGNAPANDDDETLTFTSVSSEPTPTNSAPVSAVSSLNLEAFRIIADRNIFNPNRSARTRSSRGDRERETRRPVRVESFGLLGTMAYEKGRFAFFDGSSSQYRKVVEPAQTIAGYTVMDVSPKSVTLQSTNGQQVQLAIGMQMRRQEDQDWKVSGSGASLESVAPTSSSTRDSSSSSETSASSSSPGSASSSDGENEVLKRLLQKREEELKK